MPDLHTTLLAALPSDGSSIGNQALRAQLAWDEAQYTLVRDELLASGKVAKGRGRGGAVKLLAGTEAAQTELFEGAKAKATTKATGTKAMPAKKATKKKSAKKAAKQKSFEETLWDTANKLRGSVESSDWSGATKTTRQGCPQGERGGANQYKHVVLSLIFLEFVSDKFEERRAELVAEGKEDYLDMVDWSGATETTRQGCPQGERGGAHQFYTMRNVFYLPETSRWSYIQQQAKQGDIAIKIDSALTAVEKSNASLKGALPDNYFSRLGLDVSKLSALIDAINNIDTLEDKEEDTIEGGNQNDEGRKRSQGTHQAVCAANYPPVRKPAEIDRGTDSGQTVTPLGNICRRELSRSSSWPEQSRVHREMRRLTAGTRGAERSETDWLNSQPAGDARRRGSIGVLAGTARRWRDYASRQAPTTPFRMRRTHRHLRHHHQEGSELQLRAVPSSFFIHPSNFAPLPLLHSSFSLPTSPTPPTGNANYAWIPHMVPGNLQTFQKAA